MECYANVVTFLENKYTNIVPTYFCFIHYQISKQKFVRFYILTILSWSVVIYDWYLDEKNLINASNVQHYKSRMPKVFLTRNDK